MLGTDDGDDDNNNVDDGDNTWKFSCNLFLERSIEMIVRIIGILNSGIWYVPINPRYPIERQKYILSQTSPSCYDTECQWYYLEEKLNRKRRKSKYKSNNRTTNINIIIITIIVIIICKQILQLLSLNIIISNNNRMIRTITMFVITIAIIQILPQLQ